jgi:2-iminobutanoate/2-iminopropanoate deaminase
LVLILQQKQALNNLDAILREAGTQSTNTVKATIFLSSMAHYGEVNRAYLEFFSADPKPVSLV